MYDIPPQRGDDCTQPPLDLEGYVTATFFRFQLINCVSSFLMILQHISERSTQGVRRADQERWMAHNLCRFCPTHFVAGTKYFPSNIANKHEFNQFNGGQFCPFTYRASVD